MQSSVSLYDRVINGEKKIIIPDYQREYSWTNEDIDVFLEDILKSIEGEQTYYLGTIYIYEPTYKNEIHIIDGQQRITTMIIWLLEIYNSIKGDSPNFLYLEDGSNRIYSVNEALEKAYQYSFFEGTGEYKEEEKNSQIESNMNYVKKILRSMEVEQIFEIYDYLINEAKVNIVVIEDLKMAMNIFMNLNARGKELSAIEIVKSNIYSCILDVLSYDDSNAKRMREKFNRMIYGTESKSYNDNVKNFKKCLFLYMCYKDYSKVRERKIKDNSNDKVLSSVFMKIVLEKFDFTTIEGINKFLFDFGKFTHTYIWWNHKKVGSYTAFFLEKMYIDKYVEIGKGKANEIATLVSFSGNKKSKMYEAILGAFSVIEFNKFYNSLIIGIKGVKINLGDINMGKIIELINNKDVDGFVYEMKRNKISKTAYESMKIFTIEHKEDIDKKDLERIRAVIINLKECEMLENA